MSIIFQNGVTIQGGIQMNFPSPVVTNGLRLYLDAADTTSYPGTGNTWYDLTSNHNDVVMQNSGSISYTSTGGGYFSTGSNGWFSNASGTNIPTGNSTYTLSVWVQLGPTWSSRGFISIGAFGVNNQSNAFRTSVTNNYFNYWWGNDLFGASTLSPATQWFNAVAKFDGTTRSIWINGVQVGSDTPVGHNVTTSAIQIAKTVGGEYLQGNIGQAMIYSLALSGDEINNNYNLTRGRYGV